MEEKSNSTDAISDPVLSKTTSPQSEASRSLRHELLRQNISKKDHVDKTISELCRKNNMMCQELLSSTDRWRKSSPLNRGDRVSIENKDTSGTGQITILYSRKKWKKPFCFRLNKQHYEKLKDQFFSIQSSNERVTENNERVMHAFTIIVLALLLRYSALSGGQQLKDLRGGGMQGAIHEQVGSGSLNLFQFSLSLFSPLLPTTFWYRSSMY